MRFASNGIFKVYVGTHDDYADQMKIGFTEQTCWARCKDENYHIFAARAFVDETLKMGEKLFLESYVRMSFQEMSEVKHGVRTDYLMLDRSRITETLEEWGAKWLFIFLFEAVEILNAKRDFTNTPHIRNNPRFTKQYDENFTTTPPTLLKGYVRPYSY